MKLNVTTDKEVLTLRNHTHVLSEITDKTFQTNNIAALKDYLVDFGANETVSIYYDESDIIAWPFSAMGEINFYTIPVAKCSLSVSDELSILKEHINVDIREKQFCDFLRKMAKYGSMIELMDSIENMEMKKIVSLSKSKDSRGNFSYEYSMKDEGKASFNPPKNLTITIPIFKFIGSMIEFSPDFVFSYRMQGTDETKEAILTYRLEMLNFDQYVENASIKVIEKQLEKFTCKKYWGVIKKQTETDEWKYKDVPLQFSGIPEENGTIEIKASSRY